jgi:plasmid stabilization system protein ParE
MAQKKIVWTETAASQRRSILEYWLQRNQSPNYSFRLLQASNDKATLIAENPLIHKKAEFPDTHVAAMGHFSMFYKIIDNSIIITAFWDNRQDPKKLLELLKAQHGKESK